MLYFYLFVLLVGILRRGISVEHWLAWTGWPRTCGRNPSAFICQVQEIQVSTQHTWPCCIFCGCVFVFVLFCSARDKSSLYIAQAGLVASMLLPQPANCWSGSHYTCAFRREKMRHWWQHMTTFLQLLSVHVCVSTGVPMWGTHIRARVYKWKSEDNWQKSAFFFHHVNPQGWTYHQA